MNLKAIAKDILIFSRVGEISPDLVTLVSLITFYLSLCAFTLSTTLMVKFQGREGTRHVLGEAEW